MITWSTCVCPGSSLYDGSLSRQTDGPHLAQMQATAGATRCNSHGQVMLEVTWEPLLTTYHLGGWDAVRGMLRGSEHPYATPVMLTYHTAMVLVGDAPPAWREASFAVGYEIAPGGWRRVFFPPLAWPAFDVEVWCKLHVEGPWRRASRTGTRAAGEALRASYPVVGS